MKIIKDIIPFNDFFYKDCYYNSLFSILHHYKCDIIDFLINEIALYARSEDNVLQGVVTYHSILTLKEILKKNNILVFEGYGHEGIVGKIRESIDNGMPIIIKVDCYNESIREELYHKGHLDHSLLIYGYNDIERKFCIIEHSDKNNLNYSYKLISYDDTVEANKGYLEYYGNLGEPLYMQFCRIADEEKSPAAGSRNRFAAYAANYLSYRREVMEGLKSLVVISSNIIRALRYTGFLSEHIDEILQLINEIINAKKIDKYRLNYFFTDDKILDTIDTIVSDWLYIRLSILNFKYSGNCIHDKFNASISKLEDMYCREKELNERVYSALSR